MHIEPDYIIHADQCHFGWDRSIPPVVEVNPGSIVEVETVDASGGHEVSGADTRRDGSCGLTVDPTSAEEHDSGGTI